MVLDYCVTCGLGGLLVLACGLLLTSLLLALLGLTGRRVFVCA